MDGLEHYDQTSTLTHQEIMERFEKLFGREMTPAERRAFFLPVQQSPSSAFNSGS